MIRAARFIALASTAAFLATSGPASAQQSRSTATGAPLELNQRQNQGQAAAQKPLKPAAAKPAVATRRPDLNPPPSRQWSLDDALPRDSTARRRETPQIASPPLGRIPVEGGSFGFSTETKVNAYELPDRSRIRGLDPKSDDPSYLGLSLSLTNDNKSFLPRPSMSGAGW